MPEGVGKRPTLRTIAEISGLAVATVSRALSDAPDIGEKTKHRVRRIASELGYVPNRAGLRLRTGKTNVIALMVMADEDLTDHTALLVGAIAKSLMGTAYQLSVVTYLPNGDPLAPLQQLVEAQVVDAVIFGQTQLSDPRVEYAQRVNMPCATFGRTQCQTDHAYFDFDNVLFARDAVAHLHAAGRRHVALLPPEDGLFCKRDMITGGQSEAQRLGLSFDVLTSVTANDTTEEICAGVREYLQSVPHIDGLICPSVRCSYALVKELEVAGRQLGADIDIVAKESRAFATLLRPEVCFMQEDITEAGAFLAKAAIHAIERPCEPPMKQLAKGQWHHS